MTARIPGNDGAAGGQEPIESTLCTQCALCCDGGLFHAVKVGPVEREALQSLGLTIEDAPEPFFRQPCAKLIDHTCSIYTARPKTCRNFSCALLRQVLDGEVASSKARQIVATARSLRDKVDGEVAEDWQAITDPVARRSAARRHLDRVALNEYLDRHFRVASASDG
ncbi:hypothetical protein BH10PSE14_BH10PSE14_45730 [soil metagenome]